MSVECSSYPSVGSVSNSVGNEFMVVMEEEGVSDIDLSVDVRIVVSSTGSSLDSIISGGVVVGTEGNEVVINPRVEDNSLKVD